MFSFEYYQIFKNTYFEQDLRNERFYCNELFL